MRVAFAILLTNFGSLSPVNLMINLVAGFTGVKTWLVEAEIAVYYEILSEKVARNDFSFWLLE